FLGIPALGLGLVAGAILSRWLLRGAALGDSTAGQLVLRRRRVALVAGILLACGAFLLLRTGGVSGDGDSDLHWRWTPTPAERLLALSGKDLWGPVTTPTQAKTLASWPGFRGPQRDGIVRGVKIATDWSRTPPMELWRQPVGPGWSSFAVGGDLVYTQEQ